jgi:hypothetical protein
MFVGSQAKIFTMMGKLAPRLTDKIMEAWMFYSQHSDQKASTPEPNALYKAGYGLHENGINVGWKRPPSLYIKMEKHPAITSLVMVGLGIAAYSFLSNRLKARI